MNSQLLVTILGLSSLLAWPSSGRVPEEPSLYRSVPKPDRDAFQKGVEKMIALRKASRWNEMYEIFDNERHVTRQEFIREMQSLNKLVEFVPASVTYLPSSDAWTVQGCALFAPSPPGKRGGVLASLSARRASDGWRFGDVAVLLLKDEPGGMRNCTIPASKE